MMIPLSEAQNHVLERVSNLRAMAVPLDECLDLCTSAAIVAEEAIPPFDNTAVDGFAIRTSDLEADPAGTVRLRVAGTVAAGDPPSEIAAPKTALRIMTGAVIPRRADAVVMVEDVIVEGDYITFSSPVSPGDNIRRQGSDITPGSLLFPERTVLRAAHLGVLASVGYAKVPVYRRARVGVISTGSELVDTGRPLNPGEIRDSNRHSLMAILSGAGVEVIDLGVIADDPEALRKAFVSSAADLDAIVTSGGVSVGDFDYTKAVLSEVSGGQMRWMQIAIRPAKPFAFGTIGTTPVFGLPGNPVSAMVSFELFVRPAIKKMHGYLDLHAPSLAATATNGYRRHRDGKTHFVRSLLEVDESGSLQVTSLDKQGSHMLHEMSRSNALAITPDGDGFDAGDRVMVMQLDPLTSRH